MPMVANYESFYILLEYERQKVYKFIKIVRKK